jgi:hypothetical protein
MKKFVVGVIVFWGFITTGCVLFPSKTPTPAARHAWVTKWLENPACLPPCWEGITPGVTTITETFSILQKMPGVSKTENTRGKLTGIPIRWYFDQSGGDGLVSEDDYGRVASLEIGFEYIQSLTVDEVITAYGLPTNVQAGRLQGNSGLYIIYMDKGLILDTTLPVRNEKVFVSPDTRVNNLFFIPPGVDNYLKFMKSYYNISEWKGYGSYSIR